MSTDHLTPAQTTEQIPRPRRLKEALQERFRLPTEDDAAPPTARLVGLSFWAAACGLVGLIPAGRLVVEALFPAGPGWYPAVATVIGVLGIGSIAAAFAAVHRAYLPWYLLTVATLLLATNVALMYTVF